MEDNNIKVVFLVNFAQKERSRDRKNERKFRRLGGKMRISKSPRRIE